MPALPQKTKSPSPATPTSTPSPLANPSQTAPRLGKTKIKASSLDYDIFLKHHNPSKVSSLSSTTTASINVSLNSPTSASTTASVITNLNQLSGSVLTKKFQKSSNLSQHYQQYPQQLASEWKLQHQTSLPPPTMRAINSSSSAIGATASSGNKFTTSTINQITHASSTTSLASSTITTGRYQEFKMEIINQGKCLCGQYIRARLRRAGYLNRKAIQRLRTILEPSSDVVFEVFPALNTMGEELERMHPRVYTNISRQLSRAPFGELEDSDTAPVLLNLVAKDLFRSSITWGKIISIFAVCGGFAIDCVRQGHYDYLQYLVDGIAEIIEDDLVHWLIDNGGWLGLQQHIRPQNGKITFLGWLTLFVVMSSSFYVVMKFAKHVGCHLYTFLLRKG